MPNTDKIMSEIIRNIIGSFGIEIFKDSRKASAIVSDYFTDNSLADEKALLKRVTASGVVEFIATSDKDNYSLERKKAFYVLTEREFVAEFWAEKLLGWFDEALGYTNDELEEKTDFVDLLVKASREAEEEKRSSSEKEYLSPIDMLMDENNTDNIVLFNEDDQAVEFEQIAIVSIQERVCALLKPVLSMAGIADDEALVFSIEEIDGEDCLVVVEDDETVDQVFEEYYKMLRAAGVDVE